MEASSDSKFTAWQSEKAGVTPFGPKSVIISTALSLVLEMSVIKICRAKGTAVGVVTMECSPRAKVPQFLLLQVITRFFCLMGTLGRPKQVTLRITLLK